MQSNRSFLVLAVALALGAGEALAAPSPLPPAGSVKPAGVAAAAPESASSVSALSDLLLVNGAKASVRYTPGSLDRATRVLARLEALVQLWSPFTPNKLVWSAIVIRRDEWERAGFPAWGIPQRIGHGTFVVPAEGDAGTVELARSLLGSALPQLPGDPVLGTRDEAASLIVSDLLLELEAARELAANAPLAGDAPWLTGVLMQLAVRYAWERAEPGQTLVYVGIFDAIAAAQGGPRARRLADYRGGLEYPVELWFQAQFVRGADAIWVEEGWTGTSRRLYRWGSKGKPVLAADLEKKYPALVAWQTEAFAP